MYIFRHFIEFCQFFMKFLEKGHAIPPEFVLMYRPSRTIASLTFPDGDAALPSEFRLTQEPAYAMSGQMERCGRFTGIVLPHRLLQNTESRKINVS